MKRFLICCVFIAFIQLECWSQTRTLPQQLVYTIDSLYKEGLIRKTYNLNKLRSLADSVSGNSWGDSVFFNTAAAIAWELYQGTPVSPWVGYDAVSPKKQLEERQWLEEKLREVNNAKSLLDFFAKLEPSDPFYRSLQTAYRYYHRLAIEKSSKRYRDTASWLLQSVNMQRWISHFKLEKYVVINLAAAELTYFENGKRVLHMRTIVGKPSTPSPRFAAWSERVILYPYWYVPSSIAIGEFLSKIKRNPSWLDQRDMQVVDSKGRVVDPHQLNWSQFHAGYFPYTIRQSTGCDNALGVLKFDIETPYGVYLHDTNSKSAFLSSYRFLSHGCIRLEEPLLLGNQLLENKLDTAFLQSCYMDQKPIYKSLSSPVPVFSVYMLATCNEPGQIQFHRDVYQLFSPKKRIVNLQF